MQCSRCNAVLNEGFAVCPYCGQPVRYSQPQPVQYAQPVAPPQGTTPPPATPPMAQAPIVQQQPQPAQPQVNQIPQQPAPQPAWQAAGSPVPVTPLATPVAQSLPGAIILGVLFVAGMVGLLVAGDIGTVIPTFLNALCILIPLGVAAAVTSRAGGPDFSVTGTLGLAGLVYASTGSMVLAFASGLAAGCVVAVLVGLLRMPSLLTTLAVGALLGGVTSAISGYDTIRLENEAPDFVLYTSALVAVAMGMAIVAATALGKPKAQRAYRLLDLGSIGAYVLSGLLAAMSGVALVARYTAFVPGMGNGYTLLLVLVVAAVGASKYFDNRFLPVPISVAAVFIYQSINSALMYTGANTFVGSIVSAFCALALLVPMGINKLLQKQNANKI